MVRFAAFLLIVVLFPSTLLSETARYDLAYIWDTDLESVLDYQEELETLLEQEDSRRLRIVGRKNGEYGIIYDLNGSALSSAQLMVKQGEILRKAGLSECFAIEDKGYHRLYNVSYGLGPNLDALKKLYSRIYNYLGAEVGKNLFIEETDAQNYTLIYRRRGDRVSTYSVAKQHRKLLKRKKIYTSITPENNNPVIFGESSHLNNTQLKEEAQSVATSKGLPSPAVKIERQTIAKQTPQKTEKTSITYGAGATAVEQSIETLIKDLRRAGKLSSNETTSWVVYDLTKRKSLVDINADQLFQAASMIKPFVALAFFHQVKGGKLLYGPKSRRKMEAMIQRSNNPATNWVMRVAGGPSRCEEILRAHYSHIFKNTRIVEYIPAGGKTYKNRALPSDYIRFLQALWNNELPYGKEIRRLMSLPGRDRLYNGTPIPQGTLVYNKTGSTAYLCGDMGILVPRDRKGRRYPYALVGIIERTSRPKNYGNWMLTRGNVIRKVSTLVYQEMKKQYKLL